MASIFRYESDSMIEACPGDASALGSAIGAVHRSDVFMPHSRSRRPPLVVRDLVGDHYEAILLYEGRELWRGNRSRVVLVARALEELLRHCSKPLELLTVSVSAQARRRGEAGWDSEFAGRLRFVACFGGAELCGIQLGPVAVELAHARFPANTSVAFQFHNNQGCAAEVMLVSIVEREAEGSCPRPARRTSWSSFERAAQLPCGPSMRTLTR